MYHCFLGLTLHRWSKQEDALVRGPGDWQCVFKLINLKSPTDSSPVDFGKDVWICIDEGSRSHSAVMLSTRSTKAINLIELEEEQRLLQQASSSSRFATRQRTNSKSSRPSTAGTRPSGSPTLSRPTTAPPRKDHAARKMSLASTAMAHAIAKATEQELGECAPPPRFYVHELMRTTPPHFTYKSSCGLVFYVCAFVV